MVAEARVNQLAFLDPERSLATRRLHDQRDRFVTLAIKLHQVRERRFAEVSGQGHDGVSPVAKSIVLCKKSKNFPALTHICAGCKRGYAMRAIIESCRFVEPFRPA